MILLTPGEIALIQRDYQSLVTGPDGADVIVNWIVRSGQPDEFGRYSSETPMTGAARAYITPPTSRDVTERQASNAKVADQQTGNLIFHFLPDVDLSGEAIWFHVEGLGDFVPEAKPPLANWKRDVIFSGGQRFIQEIYCRAKN